MQKPHLCDSTASRFDLTLSSFHGIPREADAMRTAESFGRNARRSWRETLITGLLGSVRLRDIACLRCELRAPWGMRVAGALGGSI